MKFKTTFLCSEVRQKLIVLGEHKLAMEKFTVIIPTRDRAETLGATLRTCMRQTYRNFDIIVSDNCSIDNTKELVENVGDPRVRYVNPGRRLSMSGNFEFALQHVTDGFVMFIGADDGMMPDAVEYVNSVVETYGVGAVACRQATYVWPNFPDKDIAGRLVFGALRDDVEIRKSREWLNKALNFETPYCFDLPNLYCGFVHKRIIDKAYKDGIYFRSITPDAFAAFATAIMVEEYAFSNRPFSIAGASAKSNGASALHPAGDSQEVSKFRAENDINIADGFVDCPSYETILAEAFAKLAQAFPDQCAPYRIDYMRMLEDSLSNANAKTENVVRAAVAVMAANFGLDMEYLSRRVRRRQRAGFASVARALGALVTPPRAVSVERTTEMGIRNIDDAALVAHALCRRTQKTARVTTTRDLVAKRLGQMMGML